MTMTPERAITTIMRWIGCSRDKASEIFEGAGMHNGAEFVAHIDISEDKLLIWKDAVLIHKISTF